MWQRDVFEILAIFLSVALLAYGANRVFVGRRMAARQKIAVTSLGTLAIFGICLYASCVGDDDRFERMALLFPYWPFIILTMKSAGASQELLRWSFPLIGFLQFACYGFLFGRSWLGGQQRRIAIRLAVFHLAAVLAIGAFLAYDCFS